MQEDVKSLTNKYCQITKKEFGINISLDQALLELDNFSKLINLLHEKNYKKDNNKIHDTIINGDTRK